MSGIIIAEAGVNHNGDINTAKKLIDVAADVGADYVKFQTFKAERLAGKSARKAEYQNRNTGDKDNSQYAMLKELELSEDAHIELINHCLKKNIKFLSTGFDETSIDFLDTLNLDLFKIPSGEITNKPLLQHIANKGKPVIMSTGMANMSEIEAAMQVLLENGLSKDQMTVLHCNTEYPTPMKDVNLKAMLTMKKSLGVNIGYSDHTLGFEVPIAAAALGATVIEKHFTLDRDMPGPDHRASLEPDELKVMIRAIRNVEKAVSGSGKKEPSASEQKNLNAARKSIVAARKINKGEVFTTENLTVKRPGNGISPMKWEKVIGTKATRDFEEDELIEV